MIKQHRVTLMHASGDIVAQLRAHSNEPIPYPTIRRVLGVRAGQAAPADARGLKMIGIYGSSEMQAVLSKQDDEMTPEQREVGGGKLITQATRVRAVDLATGKTLPHGEQGELQFKGPSCMMGYYGNEAATREAFTTDGFFRSGDLGYTVAEGDFVFLSRIGDVLRLSGFLVNPMEIEAVLDAHPSVQVSQVVGIDGPRGPLPVAWVQLKAGATLDEAALTAHCAKQIANYKVPKFVLPITDFPFTPSANGNKIQKAKLRDMAATALNNKL
jgi:fatty-acyl-CoA synthase